MTVEAREHEHEWVEITTWEDLAAQNQVYICRWRCDATRTDHHDPAGDTTLIERAAN